MRGGGGGGRHTLLSVALEAACRATCAPTFSSPSLSSPNTASFGCTGTGCRRTLTPGCKPYLTPFWPMSIVGALMHRTRQTRERFLLFACRRGKSEAITQFEGSRRSRSNQFRQTYQHSHACGQLRASQWTLPSLAPAASALFVGLPKNSAGRQQRLRAASAHAGRDVGQLRRAAATLLQSLHAAPPCTGMGWVLLQPGGATAPAAALSRSQHQRRHGTSRRRRKGLSQRLARRTA